MRIRKRQLGFPVKHVADLLPVHEILAMIDRNTWKVVETAGYQIVIFSYTAYARIRIEARNHRVDIALGKTGNRGQRQQQQSDK
jgi:hypothetical protein